MDNLFLNLYPEFKAKEQAERWQVQQADRRIMRTTAAVPPTAAAFTKLEKKISKVIQVPANIPLEWEQKNNYVYFNVPKLDIHQAIKII